MVMMVVIMFLIIVMVMMLVAMVIIMVVMMFVIVVVVIVVVIMIVFLIVMVVMFVIMFFIVMVVVMFVIVVFIIVMVMMFMGKIVADLFLAVDHHGHMRPFDAAFERFFRFHFDARDIQSVHFFNKGLLVDKFAQRTH